MDDPLDMTPKGFELMVREHLESLASSLKEFRVEHLDNLHGHDGDYVIDVTARFEALGVDFLVVVECKRFESKPIERELVQVLKQKKDSVGAHKAIMYTTSRYREGAVEFARAHGIALVQIQANHLRYAVKASIPEFETNVIHPSSGSLDDYLLEDIVGRLQVDGPKREELKVQLWGIQQLKLRLVYLQELFAEGRCGEQEVDELRAEIGSEYSKLTRLAQSDA